MSWRIVAIGIYSRKYGTLSVLEFNRTGLSIITGDSAKGKSTVLEIADYCLLSRHCGIARGPIRQAVSAVGLLAERGSSRLALVRPLPAEGRMTSSEVFLMQGDAIELPESVPQKWNANLDRAKEVLSAFTGIEVPPVLTNFESGDFEDRYPANIRHCAPLLFQPQDVIATRNVSFPGLENPFARLHTIDALHYFLGVFDMNKLRKRRQLRRLLLERRRFGRQQRESQSLRARGFDRGLQLWNEARALDLLGEEPEPANVADLADRLRAIIERVGGLKLDPDGASTFLHAEEQEALLRKELMQKRIEFSQFEERQRIEEEHTALASRQVERIALRDLLPADRGQEECPLCRAGRIDASDLEHGLETSLVAIERTQRVPERLRSQIESRQEQLKVEIEELNQQIRTIRDRMRTSLRGISEGASMLAEIRKRERLAGRVWEYLDAVGPDLASEEDNGEENVSFDEQISELQKEVGEHRFKHAMDQVQADIGSRMTAAARQLEVEFPGHPVRLNLQVDLGIELDFGKDNWVPLNQLGSGANWLGYHIAMMVALHSYLRERKAPVPGFFILDQPSQVWFPVAQAREGKLLVPTEDRDLQSLRAVYRLLYETANSVSDLQIIVFDHAKLPDSEFDSATVDEWRDHGFVPDDWF